MTDIEEAMPSEPPEKRGCLFWGLLTTFLFVVVVGGYVGFEGYQLRQTFRKFASDQLADLPGRLLQPGEYSGVEGRLKAFASAPAGSKLELTADDLNIFLSGHPVLSREGGKVNARIQGDLVYVDVSVPSASLKKLGGVLGGKYFNGTFGLKMAVEKGKLAIFPEVVTTPSGEKVPDRYISLIKTRDILSEIPGKDELSKVTSQVGKVEVSGGKVIVTR